MQLPGSQGQQKRDLSYGGAGTTTGAAQLLLPEAKSRSIFIFQNLSATNTMYLDFGAARAGAVTIVGGQVTAVAIANGGFGYTVPPDVLFLGGGDGGAGGAFVGVGDYGYPAPGDAAMAWARRSDVSGGHPARGHAVLTAGSVSSIVIDDPGSRYLVAPLCIMQNSLLDPKGVVTPSATSGLAIGPSGGYYINGTMCPTDPIALFCSAAAQAYWYRVAP